MSSYSTKQFSYNKVSKTFVAEMSDFGKKGIEVHQVYPDACDYGFVLISEKTGKECRYAHYDDHRNADGELMFAEFVAIDSVGRGTKVIIFND